MQRQLYSTLALLVMIALAFGSSDSETNYAPDNISAWVMAQQFVEDKLKSPSTADYGSVMGDYQAPDDVVQDLGGGKFKVTAWVDSQNSFGATIRTRFVCELEHTGGDSWRCTNLTFAE